MSLVGGKTGLSSGSSAGENSVASPSRNTLKGSASKNLTGSNVGSNSSVNNLFAQSDEQDAIKHSIPGREQQAALRVARLAHSLQDTTHAASRLGQIVGEQYPNSPTDAANNFKLATPSQAPFSGLSNPASGQGLASAAGGFGGGASAGGVGGGFGGGGSAGGGFGGGGSAGGIGNRPGGSGSVGGTNPGSGGGSVAHCEPCCHPHPNQAPDPTGTNLPGGEVIATQEVPIPEPATSPEVLPENPDLGQEQFA